jgi:hypothetical protein
MNRGATHLTLLFHVIAQNKNYTFLGWGRGTYRVLVGKPEGRKLLGIPRCRWQNNIKMDRKEIGLDGADWIYLARDMDRWRDPVNTVLKTSKFFSPTNAPSY